MNSDSQKESKELRLARYLKEFVGLRSKTVRDVAKYDTVLWFGEMPQEPECQSPAWVDGWERGNTWLEVRKPQFPKAPVPPEAILSWVDQQALQRASDAQSVLSRGRVAKNQPRIARLVGDSRGRSRRG